MTVRLTVWRWLATLATRRFQRATLDLQRRHAYQGGFEAFRTRWTIAHPKKKPDTAV